ncbi:MAG: succinate dehydrogenase assembly factor 2 [Betaproteobacteria bacterium]|nr:succinate dehydrogenase assembly factor 2 [Betaproteobacteria bacterium]
MSHSESADESCAQAAALRRLRWRSRRGLLENDLLFTRFFARHGESLQPGQVAALGELLELDDNTLLALLLGHIEPPPEAQAAQRLGLLDLLRAD